MRLDQLAQMADHVANEYTPGLMIITWEDETLDEVIERVSPIRPDHHIRKLKPIAGDRRRRVKF